LNVKNAGKCQNPGFIAMLDKTGISTTRKNTGATGTAIKPKNAKLQALTVLQK
jgi:hypothetical protein